LYDCISKKRIAAYGSNNPYAIKSLNHWYIIVNGSNWQNIAEMKYTFNNVDYVGNDRYVFNIKGNKYRLVAMFFF